jgi:hypothetical protein
MLTCGDYSSACITLSDQLIVWGEYDVEYEDILSDPTMNQDASKFDITELIDDKIPKKVYHSIYSINEAHYYSYLNRLYAVVMYSLLLWIRNN